MKRYRAIFVEEKRKQSGAGQKSRDPNSEKGRRRGEAELSARFRKKGGKRERVRPQLGVPWLYRDDKKLLLLNPRRGGGNILSKPFKEIPGSAAGSSYSAPS